MPRGIIRGMNAPATRTDLPVSLTRGCGLRYRELQNIRSIHVQHIQRAEPASTRQVTARGREDRVMMSSPKRRSPRPSPHPSVWEQDTAWSLPFVDLVGEQTAQGSDEPEDGEPKTSHAALRSTATTDPKGDGTPHPSSAHALVRV
jgi:hypothetical protein